MAADRRLEGWAARRAKMPAMRILHLVGRSHRRGAEQVAQELAAELEVLGHRNRIRAVSLGHGGERIDRFPPLVGDDRQRPWQLARAALELRRDLARHPTDLILAHGAAATLTAVLAAPGRPPRIVTQTIMGLAPATFRGIRARCWRVALKRVDGAVALTQGMGEELRTLGYQGPVWPIPNARRTERFAGLDRAAAAVALRAEVGASPDQLLVGLVGYLVEHKRPERAVEVLAGLRARNVDAHLIVAGSGPLAGAVHHRAFALGVAEQVTMLGHRDDVEQVLAGLDVAVMTSDDEGIPGVLVEAAMAGCPVVSYPLGGVDEVIVDGLTGVVLDQASVAGMVAALVDLAGDPERRASMSTEARRHGSDFAMERIATRYHHHLSACVEDEI